MREAKRLSNSGGNVTDADAQERYEELSVAAYGDPAGARETFLELLRSSPALAREIATHAISNRDARLRQVVARAVWRQPERELVRDILVKWRDTEDDEFTLSAIKDALAEPKSRIGRAPRAPTPAPFPDVLGTYRYVSSRMRHRTLNAMPEVSVTMQLLRREAQRIADPQVYARMAPILDDLFASLGHLEKAVENDEDAYFFDSSSIAMHDWLVEYRQRFTGEFGPLEMEVDFSACDDGVSVRATPYWLMTVFWNLWKNSMDAVGRGCKVVLIGSQNPKSLKIVLLDNGDGFKQEDQDRGFMMRYSTKGDSHGRGHMEVADAMQRLGGGARIVRYKNVGYRSN